MKKNIILLLGFLALVLVSCEKTKDSEGLSSITYFPEFTMNGEAEKFLRVGEVFTDLGVIAEENGVEIPVTSVVQGDFFGYSGTEVPTDAADKYIITYTATNSDGYPGTTERIVWVTETGDLVTSIAGLYTSTVVRNGSTGPAYTDMEYIMISDNGDGTYNLSDAIGGYYDLGRGYGANYRAAGLVITANNIPTNDFSFSGTIPVGAFGGVLTMTLMSVDAGAGTLSFTSGWQADAATLYTFEVTLTQVEL